MWDLNILGKKHFLGIGSVFFLFITLLFLVAGLWFGALGALLASFLMTPFTLGYIARSVDKERLPIIHRFMIGFVLMMLPLGSL